MSKYFTHDTDAMSDPKCMMLVGELGMEGYGMFWALIELLGQQKDYSLPVVMIPVLAQRLGVSEAKLRTVIGNYGLFAVQGDRVFFSESLSRRMAAIESAAESRKKKALNAAKNRWEKGKKEAGKCSSIAQAMLKQCPSNAQALKPDNQVFTNLGNSETPKSPYIYNNNNNIYNIKGGAGGENPCFVKPTVEDVAAYISEKNFDVDAAAFVAFYESKGWKVGRSPMVRWKQAVVTWQYRKGGKANEKLQNKNKVSIYDDCLR